MKKILLLMILTALAFAGCSKNDEGYPLNGTTWIHNDSALHQVSTLKFQKKTFSLYYIRTKNEVQETKGITGTYEYSDPNIIITAEGRSITVQLSENKIIFDEGEFVKQTK